MSSSVRTSNRSQKCVQSGCVAQMLYPIAWRSAENPNQPRFACSKHLAAWEFRLNEPASEFSNPKRTDDPSTGLAQPILDQANLSVPLNAPRVVHRISFSNVKSKVDSGLERKTEPTQLHTYAQRAVVGSPAMTVSNKTINATHQRPNTNRRESGLRLRPGLELFKPTSTQPCNPRLQPVLKFIALTPNSKRILCKAAIKTGPQIPSCTKNLSIDSTKNSFCDKLASSFKETNLSTPNNSRRVKLINGSPMSPIRTSSCLGNSSLHLSDLKVSPITTLQMSNNDFLDLHTGLTIKSIKDKPKGFLTSSFKNEYSTSRGFTPKMSPLYRETSIDVSTDRSFDSINEKPNISKESLFKNSSSLDRKPRFINDSVAQTQPKNLCFDRQLKTIIIKKSPAVSQNSTTDLVEEKPTRLMTKSFERNIKLIKKSPVSRDASIDQETKPTTTSMRIQCKTSTSFKRTIKLLKTSPISRETSIDLLNDDSIRKVPSTFKDEEALTPKKDNFSSQQPSPVPILNRNAHNRIRQYTGKNLTKTRQIIGDNHFTEHSAKRAFSQTPTKSADGSSQPASNTPTRRPKLLGNINHPWIQTPPKPKPKKVKKEHVVPFQFGPKISRVRLVSGNGRPQDMYIVNENSPKTAAPAQTRQAERTKTRVHLERSPLDSSRRPLFPANQLPKSVDYNTGNKTLRVDHIVDLMQDYRDLS